ncbi:MAG: hypothetical protein WD894_02110 [Pirellulales bacterium]
MINHSNFVTLGCGLSANRGSGMRDPWFFITDQRVGEDLFLQSEAGHALSRSALIEAIGDRCRVYTTNSDDAAWDRIQEAVTTRIQDLNTALSQHSFTSTLVTSDGLYRVTVPYQGRDRSINELRDLLSEEVDQRQLVLDEREREIIENHLIGEVAAKLHEQIHQAHRLVDKMNDEIQKCPMSTGMTLKFDWKPDDELSSGIVEM